MSSEQNAMPDRRAIDDQLIMAVNILRAAGLHDAADWIAKNATARVRDGELPPEIVALHRPITNEEHGTESGLISGYCHRCRIPWPCLFSPERLTPPASEPSRTDAVKGAIAYFSEGHASCRVDVCTSRRMIGMIEAALADAPAGEAERTTEEPAPRIIDGKFRAEVRDGRVVIVKSSSGEIVPEDEPLMLQRGRDHLMLPTLQHYRKLSELDGCNDYHMAGVDRVIARFANYASDPSRMKQPGITRGAAWNPDAPPPEPASVDFNAADANSNLPGIILSSAEPANAQGSEAAKRCARCVNNRDVHPGGGGPPLVGHPFEPVAPDAQGSEAAVCNTYLYVTVPPGTTKPMSRCRNAKPCAMHPEPAPLLSALPFTAEEARDRAETLTEVANCREPHNTILASNLRREAATLRSYAELLAAKERGLES